jgi:hypothetical protein
VVKNFAVCNQPIATVAADFSGAVFAGWAEAGVLGFEDVDMDRYGKPKAPL